MKITNYFEKTLILVLACFFANGNVLNPLLLDPLGLEGLCAKFPAPEISGIVLCPTGTDGIVEQQSCDKHCQCAHAATYGSCHANSGSSAVYCHCLYTPAPSGQAKWNNSDLICAGWSNVAVTVLCNVTQTSVISPIGMLAPLCYLDCPCIHKITTGNYGTCGVDPSTGQQKCFCNR